MRRTFVRIAAGSAVALLVCAAASLRAQSGPPFAIDSARVYYGNPATARRPARVSMAAVFEATTSWRDARAMPVNPESAPSISLYWERVGDANKRFSAAIRAVAARRGFDLVAERGAVRPREAGAPEAADLTDEAIVEVERGRS